MTPIAVMTVQGVLKDQESGTPIPAGKRLYHALAASYRVVLVADEPVHEVWLAVHGFDAHKSLIDRLPEDPDDSGIRRIRQIERLRGMGGTVEILVDPDPSVAASIVRLGIVCLHYVDPPYARPEFHPDNREEITPWDQMVEELDQIKILRASDNRLNEED